MGRFVVVGRMGFMVVATIFFLCHGLWFWWLIVTTLVVDFGYGSGCVGCGFFFFLIFSFLLRGLCLWLWLWLCLWLWPVTLLPRHSSPRASIKVVSLFSPVIRTFLGLLIWSLLRYLRV